MIENVRSVNWIIFVDGLIVKECYTEKHAKTYAKKNLINYRIIREVKYYNSIVDFFIDVKKI